MSARKFRRPRETFLSHSSKDRRFAMRLATMLRDHGMPVWYAPTEIIGAQQWHDEIGSALARCDWFVLVLSFKRRRVDLCFRRGLLAGNSYCLPAGVSSRQATDWSTPRSEAERAADGLPVNGGVAGWPSVVPTGSRSAGVVGSS